MTTQITSTDFPGLVLVVRDDGTPAYVERRPAIDNLTFFDALEMITRYCGQVPEGYGMSRDVPYRVDVVRAGYAACACVLPEQSCPVCRDAARRTYTGG